MFELRRYKTWLEAIGCSHCFDLGMDCQPIIFCGTCSKLDVQFYAMTNADNDDKRRLSKPLSEAKRLAGVHVVRAASPEMVKFVIRDLFAVSITDLASFLQLAMFLWRVRRFRYAS